MALEDTIEGRSLIRAFTGHDGSLARLREPDLTSRLAAWLEAEGIASAGSAPDLAERIIAAAGDGKASAWLGDGSGSQALRDAATGIAAIASLGDAGWDRENILHGHGNG
jgi:hypothetical protein